MPYFQRLIFFSLHIIILHLVVPGVAPVKAGDGEYLSSAHGSSSYGVFRPSMTDLHTGSNYATGSCGHCHDMHASINGVEPTPDNNGPSEYTLFSPNFNTTATPGSYLQTDNFCFYCHSGLGTNSVQTVINADYGTTFGGGATGTLPQYIMEAFNQQSFHNLADIHDFVDGKSSLVPWYNIYSNPCNACHNPHLAKKNYTDFIPPLSSALSKPSDHFNLWGESQLMSSYTSYEAPYSSTSTLGREPDGSTTDDGSKTPDYVGFCIDCHKPTNSIRSTTPTVNKILEDIDWSNSGDKHGGLIRDGGVDLLEPFATGSASKPNLILSCLDCHEPHGAPNIMLIRKRVNGGDLNATITTTDSMGSLCRQCHKDDDAANAGTGIVDKWRYIHHESTDAPYPGPPKPCDQCHDYGIAGSGGQPKIPCGYCHFHNSDDSWLGTVGLSSHQTNRKTF